MTGKMQDSGRKFAPALLPVLMFILASFSPMLIGAQNGNIELEEPSPVMPTNSEEPWTGLDQPWGQFARTPTHNATMPAHGPNGGPGTGSVENLSVLGTIEKPGVNWEALDDGSDLYGSIIADFSNSITATEAAIERCAEGDLFAVLVHGDASSTYLSLAAGDDAKIAWEVDLSLIHI